MLFVSHATSEDQFVDVLVGELAAFGLESWVDHRDMPAGSRWVAHLETALRDSELMLLICSEGSMASTYVEAEWHTYFDMKRPIIPIRVDDCAVPPFLRTLHQLDFRNEAQFQKNLASLMETIEFIFGKTVHQKPQQAFSINEQNLDGCLTYILDQAQETLEDYAPTYRKGTMQLIFPQDGFLLQYPLTGELVIGRKHRSLANAPAVELSDCTHHSLISRSHASLHYKEGKLYIQDLCSTNGTYIDGKRIAPHRLHAVDNFGVVHLSEYVPMVIRYAP